MRLDGAGKQYPSGSGAGLVGRLIGRRNTRPWALAPLDLTITSGKSIAILGTNGSGKSTLLGVAAGTITPTTGRVVRLTDPTLLFQIGTSFDEELSGAENTRLELLLLGLSGRVLRERVDAAREFSGVEGAWDEPLRTYSAGMRARIAMAAALADSRPLLLIDEILAVGDVAFVAKCIDHFRELRRHGTALMFVTHDTKLAESLGDEAIVLDGGAEAARGSLDACLAAYQARLGFEAPSTVASNVLTAGEK